MVPPFPSKIINPEDYCLQDLNVKACMDYLTEQARRREEVVQASKVFFMVMPMVMVMVVVVVVLVLVMVVVMVIIIQCQKGD